MPATAWLRKHSVELGWAFFAAANFAAMVAWPSWEAIPFYLVWISLTLVYGFRVWSPRTTGATLAVVILVTGASIMADAFDGIQLWGELFEVPLMSAMFLAMVWHARRRQSALGEVEALLDQQERFLHDISHELRTPVTIAQGHLELLERNGAGGREVEIALDELGRIEGIIARLLLLAKAGHASYLEPIPIDAEQFLEDVFLRWSDVAPRGWRLGPVPSGWVYADADALRSALDALIENALKYTERRDSIELRARVLDFGLVFDVIDSGPGIAPEKAALIFERFGRSDDARTRTTGGVGLGLAIVDAVAKAHGGLCTVVSRPGRTVFSLRVPDFRAGTLDPKQALVRGSGPAEVTQPELVAARAHVHRAEPPEVGRR